jgi:circadian clock protein KaiC
MPDESFLQLQMHELLTYLNMQGVSTFLILAQQGIVGPVLSNIDISYLADSIILLRYFEAMGGVRKAISIFKKRSGPHETTIRELQLKPGDIVVGAPLNTFQGVLTGSPVYSGKSTPLLDSGDGDEQG